MYSPFGNTTQPAAWHSEPSHRGTYGLLSTCIITLGLCVWTAVHLNIPAQGKSSRQILRKLKWLLIALLSPEVVVYTAYTQYIFARKLHRQAQEYVQ